MTQADILRSVTPKPYGVAPPRPPASAERRIRIRFAVDLPFSYCTLEQPRRSGEGRIVNLSSSGALVACSHELAADTPVEIAIEWPTTRVAGRTTIQLVMTGRVVRCDVSGFAMEAYMRRFVLAGQTSTAEAAAGTRDLRSPGEPALARRAWRKRDRSLSNRRKHRK